MTGANKTAQEMISPEVINLVIARLKTVPSNANLSIGNIGERLSPQQLIDEVTRQTEIGKSFVETQLFFLRSLQDLQELTT